jgi:hypothetical protein
MQQFNYVGVDASLTSTAVNIRTPDSNILLSFTKNYKPSKWTKELEPFTVFFGTSFKDVDGYSELEISKLEDYEKVANWIVDEIAIRTNNGLETKVAIEGYSYSSAAGPLIDLVTFGTLLRKRLRSQFKHLTIYAPAQLKKGCAQLVYQADKKGVYRNNDGTAGGSFKKPDMCKAMLDSSNLDLNDNFKNFLQTNWSDLSSMKNLPKPTDDLSDAIWACEVLSKNI